MGAKVAKHNKEFVWSERRRYMKMSPDTKRRYYFCQSNYKSADHVVTWHQYHLETFDSPALEEKPYHRVDDEINNKVALLEADITCCEIDGIVTYLYEGFDLKPGTVSRVIMARAGQLYCDEIIYKGAPCPGGAIVVGGYMLPARYVINTAIPSGLDADQLAEAYVNSLEAAIGHGMRSIAFPCLSTKRFKGFSKERATHVALNTVREWLNKNKAKVEMVIFCVLNEDDLMLYERLMQLYFPITDYRYDAEATSGGENGQRSQAEKLRQIAEWQSVTRRQHGTEAISVTRCFSGPVFLKQLASIYLEPAAVDLRKRPSFRFLFESGLDLGAISREFFYNALAAVGQRQLGMAPAFEGQADRRLPCASKAHSSQNAYEIVGTLLAHSVLHDGSGLAGLSPAVVFLLSHPVSRAEVDTSGIVLDMCDVPDVELRQLLEKATRLDSLGQSEQNEVRHDLLTAMEKCNIGYCPITTETIPAIQQEILLYEVVFKRWDQIEQLRYGMDILHLYDFLCKNPTEENVRRVFPRSGDMAPTPERIKSNLVASGIDQTTLSYFLELLDEIHAGNIANISLGDLVAFWTGTPILTSDPLNLSIGAKDQLPVAHCCFLQMKLPRVTSYKELKDKFILALQEGSKGFQLK